MRTKSFLVILLGLTLIFSCSRNSDLDIEENNFEVENQFDFPNQQNLTFPPPSDCIITAAMVNGEPATTGAPYTVYASTGIHTVNYDRRVEIYLSKNSTIYAVAQVIIPANQNVSNNAAIENACGGSDLDVNIANVTNLSNGSRDNSCTWRSTTGFLPECGSSPSDCGNNFSVGENSGLVNLNDQDGDGVCAGIDPDDEDPCNPDPFNGYCDPLADDDDEEGIN